MWPFKAKTKTLVGKIKALYEFTDTKRKATMFFLLYENGGKRSFEVVIEDGRSILENWYDNTTYRKNNYKGFDDFLTKNHRHWANDVKPWLDGCPLNPKYRFSYDNCNTFITADLKLDMKAFFLYLKTHHGIDCSKDDDSIGSVLFKKILEAKEV